MRPVLVDFGHVRIFGSDVPLAVHSYGLFFVLALGLGWWLCVRAGRRVRPDAPWTLIYLGSVSAGVIGARVLSVLVFLPRILAGDHSVQDVLLDGGAWLPGVLCGTSVLWWLGRRHGLALGVLSNVFFLGIPLVHAVGRIGCLLGGCCYGQPTDLPWSLLYTDALASQHGGVPLGVGLHPTPLYEILAEAFNAVVLWRLWQRRPAPWQIPATWALLYGIERFAIEFVRGDPRGQWGPFSTSQWIALALVPLAAWVLWHGRQRPAPTA